MNGKQVGTSAQRVTWSKGRRAYALCMIGVVLALFQVDRQVLTISLEPIKHDLGVSDAMMGIMSGTAFGFLFIVAGIPIARLSDRGNRRSLLSLCTGVMSAAAIGCGFATGYVQLMLARAFVASGEAGTPAASQSILADLYPAERRGTASGAVAAFASIGIAIGLFAGGWLNHTIGWRGAFIAVGIPGLAIALILHLSVSEPPRGMSDSPTTDDDHVPRFNELIRFAAVSRVVRRILLLSTLSTFAGYGILTWSPTFLLRVHGMPIDQVGLWMGTATAFGFFSGNLLSGWLSDHVGKGDSAASYAIATWGTFAAFPFALLFLFAPSATISLVAMAAMNVLLTFWLAPTQAALMTASPPRMRGALGMMWAISQTLIGLGLGPLAIGVMNDALAAKYGLEAIRYSMGLMSVMIVVAGIAAFRVRSALGRERNGGTRI